MSVLGLCVSIVGFIITFVTGVILGTVMYDKQAHRDRLKALEQIRKDTENEPTPIWNAMVLEDPERYVRTFSNSLPLKDNNDK